MKHKLKVLMLTLYSTLMLSVKAQTEIQDTSLISPDKPNSELSDTYTTLFLGGGIIMPSSALKTNAMVDNGLNFNSGIFIPVGKSVFGLAAKLDYSSLINNNILPSSIEAIKYNNGTETITTVAPIFENKGKASIVTALAGPSLLFSFKKIYLNPSLFGGYFSFSQKGFDAYDSIQYIPNPLLNKNINFFSSGSSTSSGFIIQPELKIGYAINKKVSVFGSVDYSFGSTITNTYNTFLPSGSPGITGVYEIDQLIGGTTTSATVESKYNLLALNVGLAFTINGKENEKEPVISEQNTQLNGKDDRSSVPPEKGNSKKINKSTDSQEEEVSTSFEDATPQGKEQPDCASIISPKNGSSHNLREDLKISVTKGSVKNKSQVSYTLYKISNDKDFWVKANAATRAKYEGPDLLITPTYEAEAKATGFTPITNSLSGDGNTISREKLSEGAYKLIVNSNECPSGYSLFSITSADVTITNFTVACGSELGSYTYTLTANNLGNVVFVANSLTFTSPGGSISAVTPGSISSTINPSNPITITGSFSYSGSYPSILYATLSGNQVGNTLLTSLDTESDSLYACICNSCETISWNIGEPTQTLQGNNINIIQPFNPTGYGNIVAAKAEIIAFERYVGDSCMSCNKDWNQWGNFTSGTYAGINGGLGNAVTPVTGNTHHSMYWNSAIAAGSFNLNISTPPLSNLNCCCDVVAATIRYTYTFRQDNGACISCSFIRGYTLRKGYCPRIAIHNPITK
ncbi:MAG: hypothetical protein SGJ15_04105 [Bacteroidota bacterium]|nr:hypothetical protein [Bacteroidota bacterium]